MTNKEFRSELRIVITWLWRNPCTLGLSKVHLLEYISKDAFRMYPERIQQDIWTRKVRVNGKTVETACLEYTKDQMYLLDLLLDMYFLMYEVLESNHCDAGAVKRIMRTWISKVSRWHYNLTTLGKALKTFVDCVLTKVQDTDVDIPRYCSWNLLMDSIKAVAPDLHWFFIPVKGIWNKWMKDGSIDAFRDLYQIGEYILRGNMTSVNTHEAQELEYLEFEDMLSQNPIDEPNLKALETVASACITDEDIDYMSDRIVPKHGSGSVSGFKGRLSKRCKYAMIRPSKRLLKDIPELERFVPSGSINDMRGTPPRWSEIVFVPKNLLVNRVISKEPITQQWAQQGLFAGMKAMFENPSFSLFKRIELERADKNGALAAIGSYGGEFATIDLHAASDSVTVSHVRCLPRRLRRKLMAARCGITSFGGVTVKMRKFAPMGAATCFPVECLVFSLVCVLAIASYHHMTELTPESVKSILRRSKFRVYGDDIVIEAKYAPYVYEWLEKLHFEVNKRKSYTQQHVLNFRESCGSEFLNGTDVHVLRTARKRVRWVSNPLSPEKVLAMVDHRNDAFFSRWFLLTKLWDLRLRRTTVTVVGNRGRKWKEPLWGLLPFFNEDEYSGQVGLVTMYNPNNHHLTFRKGQGEFLSGFQSPWFWGLIPVAAVDKTTENRDIEATMMAGFPLLSDDTYEYLSYWEKVACHSSRFVPPWQETYFQDAYLGLDTEYLGRRYTYLSIGKTYR